MILALSAWYDSVETTVIIIIINRLENGVLEAAHDRLLQTYNWGWMPSVCLMTFPAGQSKGGPGTREVAGHAEGIE